MARNFDENAVLIVMPNYGTRNYGAVSVQFRATARMKFDSRVKFNVNTANSVYYSRQENTS